MTSPGAYLFSKPSTNTDKIVLARELFGREAIAGRTSIVELIGVQKQDETTFNVAGDIVVDINLFRCRHGAHTSFPQLDQPLRGFLANSSQKLDLKAGYIFSSSL